MSNVTEVLTDDEVNILHTKNIYTKVFGEATKCLPSDGIKT